MYRVFMIALVLSLTLLLGTNSWAAVQKTQVILASAGSDGESGGGGGTQGVIEESLRRAQEAMQSAFSLGLPGMLRQTLRWPDKTVNIDVKDQTLDRLAEVLTKQTGIQFVIGEGVPKNLKVTIRANGINLKEFLDTLTASTGLVYVAEGKAESAGKKEAGKAAAGVKTGSVTVITKPSPAPQSPVPPGMPGMMGGMGGGGFGVDLPPGMMGGMGGYGGGGFGVDLPPVTRVTIMSLRSAGVIVNMGMVSLALKNADPIEAVTRLIDRIDGAGYVMMSLDDYIALQDPDKAEAVKKAVNVVSRPKITLELRNVPMIEALKQLADRGRFYITVPKPGVPSFLIIPDVAVTDKKAMPGLDSVPFFGGGGGGFRRRNE